MQLPQFQVHAQIETRHWWFRGRRTIFCALLRRLVPTHRGAMLLDVGSGTGGNTEFFSSDYDCTGVEPIAEAVAFAKKRFPQCRFIHGLAPKDVPREMADADIVLLADVLEHVKDDRTLVRDLIHAMKPGAVLLVMAPADMKLWSPHDRGFGHFRRYDLETARALWRGLPVEELLCSYCNARLYWPIRLIRIVTRFFGRSFGPSDTDLSLPPAALNDLLRKLFESEAKRLVNLLEGKTKRGFHHGVSFIAMLRRY